MAFGGFGTLAFSLVGRPLVAGKYLLGDLCQPSYNEPAASTYVLEEGSDASAFAPPTGMEFNWNSQSTGAVDGGFYTPTCPSGYVALGCVGETSLPNSVTSPAPTDVKRWSDLRCVREEYAEVTTFSSLNWADHGSGGAHDGSVFTGASDTYNGTQLMGPCQCSSGYPTSISGYKLKSALFAGWGADAPIKITAVANYEQSYADHGTGSKADLSMWGPSLVPPAPPEQPEQVHLALGKTADSMTVAWVTSVETAAEVQWGETAASLSQRAEGDSREFSQDSGRTWYTHVATLSGLKANTRYHYRVGARDHRSQTFSFMHRRVGAPYRHVIMGDLGASCGFSLCPACTAGSEVCDAAACAANTSAGMVSEVDRADMVLHMGDFGYDLDSNNGKTGDQFMRNIEQLAAYMPYMVNHGNHEDGSKSLAHYVERFRSQPVNAVPSTFTSSNGETANSLYFSWDAGLVHYVSISTEIWFGVSDGKVTLQTQLDWLKADLAAANANREAVPWVVVQGHRSVYCSCDGDCDGAASKVREDLEELFMDYGVDFYINGHEHNYERSFPMYQSKSDRSNVDPKAPIYIVSGSAGSREMHEPFTRTQPSWSAFRSNTFGYSVLTVHNATHAHWQQISTDPTSFPLSSYGAVIDDAWVVQHAHGPFDRSQAPKGVAFAEGLEHPRGRSLDHWLPLLGLDDGESAGDRLIERFRAERGEAEWHARLNALMRWVDEELGAEIMWRSNATSVVHWEDVRDDGSSDCATCGPQEALEVYHAGEVYRLFV